MQAVMQDRSQSPRAAAGPERHAADRKRQRPTSHGIHGVLQYGNVSSRNGRLASGDHTFFNGGMIAFQSRLLTDRLYSHFFLCLAKAPRKGVFVWPVWGKTGEMEGFEAEYEEYIKFHEKRRHGAYKGFGLRSTVRCYVV